MKHGHAYADAQGNQNVRLDVGLIFRGRSEQDVFEQLCFHEENRHVHSGNGDCVSNKIKIIVRTKMIRYRPY